MKITAKQLRNIIKEVMDEDPKTRRGIGVRHISDQASDDMASGVPTMRGMGIKHPEAKSVDSMYSDWTAPQEMSDECSDCGGDLNSHDGTCAKCSSPQTMRSPGVA